MVTVAEKHLRRGKFKLAAREFKQLLSRYGYNSRYHLGYSIALIGMGKLDEARRHLDELDSRGGHVPSEVKTKLKSLTQAQSKPQAGVKPISLSVRDGDRRKPRKSGKKRNRRRTVGSAGNRRGPNYAKFGGDYVQSRPSRGSVRLIG